MARLQINSQFCKECKLCMTACKKGVLKISKVTNHMGYHPVMADNENICTRCKMCAVICPEAAIEIY